MSKIAICALTFVEARMRKGGGMVPVVEALDPAESGLLSWLRRWRRWLIAAAVAVVALSAYRCRGQLALLLGGSRAGPL
jgi:hypothetical protein